MSTKSKFDLVIRENTIGIGAFHGGPFGIAITTKLAHKLSKLEYHNKQYAFNSTDEMLLFLRCIAIMLMNFLSTKLYTPSGFVLNRTLDQKRLHATLNQIISIADTAIKKKQLNVYIYILSMLLWKAYSLIRDGQVAKDFLIVIGSVYSCIKKKDDATYSSLLKTGDVTIVNGKSYYLINSLTPIMAISIEEFIDKYVDVGMSNARKEVNKLMPVIKDKNIATLKEIFTKAPFLGIKKIVISDGTSDFALDLVNSKNVTVAATSKIIMTSELSAQLVKWSNQEEINKTKQTLQNTADKLGISISELMDQLK